MWSKQADGVEAMADGQKLKQLRFSLSGGGLRIPKDRGAADPNLICTVKAIIQ